MEMLYLLYTVVKLLTQ